MFFYISFLRPPPSQALPSSQIKLTPQIANDLRTEPFEGSQDIYFAWQPVTTGSGLQTTKPTKLTTWRQANAYKELVVSPPSGVREGQQWRLILTSEPQNLSIPLHGTTTLGQRPFPVLSMPILFTRQASKSLGKQEQIERIYRFPTLREEVAMRITEQTSFDLDKKIWDSGIGLSSWLVEMCRDTSETTENPTVNDLRNKILSSEPQRIIELGAGTGIVSLALSALRSALLSADEQDLIITTDLPSAMPLLEHNIKINSQLFSTQVTPLAKVLDWDEDLPQYTEVFGSDLDIIVMADVTYNTASFPSLIKTMSSLVHLNRSNKPPVILLGYKERDIAERSLWDMARDIGVQFQQVDQVNGAGGAPIEIWIGSVEPST